MRPLKKPTTSLPPLVKRPESEIVQTSSLEWVSSGVSKKPSGCDACKYALIGAGFCGDDNPEGKRLAVLCPSATKGEILEQKPWHGAQGSIFSRMFLADLGIPRSEVMIAHVLRCRPPFRKTSTGMDSYPSGSLRRAAELTCRQYDDSHTYRGNLLPGGIKRFDPDTFLVTFQPEMALEVTAYKRIIQRDFERAWELVAGGRRVCIVMGEPAFDLVENGMRENGGVKNWRGHYWRVQGWPMDLAVTPAVKASPFKSVKGRFGRR